jgi:hypothetical protein
MTPLLSGQQPPQAGLRVETPPVRHHVVMKFVHEMTYDAPAEAVAAMMADPAFRERVCEYQQVLEHSVSILDDDGLLTVAVDQVQEARGIPSYAVAFVGDRIAIEQRETWHSPALADLTLKVRGKPAQMTGTITLRAEGERTIETVSGEVKVSVPLVGGRIEAVVGDVIRLALDAEYAVGRVWLAQA